jgi:hypothetical protein
LERRSQCYSLSIGYGFGQPIYSLEAWRNRWQSDLDSAAAPPVYLDPQKWRALPSQPKRRDGKHYGADGDSVARTLPP